MMTLIDRPKHYDAIKYTGDNLDDFKGFENLLVTSDEKGKVVMVQFESFGGMRYLQPGHYLVRERRPEGLPPAKAFAVSEEELSRFYDVKFYDA